MLVRDYVEQWTVLVNMHGTWCSNITVMDLYRVIKTLADNFPSRLYKCFVFRPPKVFSKVTKILKRCLSDTTFDKIYTEKHKLPKQLLMEASKCQLEAHYGGTADSRHHFWPPFVPVEPFD